MQPWRAIIVDDEESARNRLVRLLEAHSEISIAGTASNIAEAVELFSKEKPHLVFLDIEMRGENGFDLLPLLHPVPKIIFVTGHESFALKAFEVNAVDYILKPVFAGRLDSALKRIFQPEPAVPEEPQEPFEENDLLFLRTPQSSIALKARDILHITAAGNFSHVVASEKRKVMIYRTLAQWEQRLPADLFRRVDRSLIMNVSRLSKIDPVDRNTADVHLEGSSETLRIGRTALQRLNSSFDRP